MASRNWEKLRRRDKAGRGPLDLPPISSMPEDWRREWVKKMALRYGPKFGAKMARQYLS